MNTKSIATEARAEAAAAEIQIATAMAAAAGAGFKGSADQLPGAACVAAAVTAVTGVVAFNALGAGRPFKITGFVSGSQAVGGNACNLLAQTSVDAGVTWVTQRSAFMSGIPTAGLGGTTDLGAYIEAVVSTIPAGPVQVRLAVTPSAATYTTSGSATQGEVSVFQN